MIAHARTDVITVAIPTDAGGCGQPHHRPLNKDGEPLSTWALACPLCTLVLKDDPCWAVDRNKIPLTPGEQELADQMEKKGDQVMHQVAAAMAQSSMDAMRKQQAEELNAHNEAATLAGMRADYERAMKEVAELKMLLTGVAEARNANVVPDQVKADISDGTPEIVAHGRNKCKSCHKPVTKVGRGGAWPSLCLDCISK